MNVEEMKTIFESNNNIKFKLYSLEYIIEKRNDFIVVYAIDYPTRKKEYKTFEEALNNFTVYNESLNDQLNKIKKI